MNDLPAYRSRDLNYGNIVTLAAQPDKTALRPARLLARRCGFKLSSVLAGLLACAAFGPSRAATPTTDGAVEWVAYSGSASWYGASPRYRRTASGAPFNQNAMTAAHPWLPFGSKVRVTRRDTGHSIVVMINDRLPSKHHSIDLSLGAARQLGMVREGTAQVDLEPVEAPPS